VHRLLAARARPSRGRRSEPEQGRGLRGGALRLGLAVDLPARADQPRHRRDGIVQARCTPLGAVVLQHPDQQRAEVGMEVGGEEGDEVVVGRGPDRVGDEDDGRLPQRLRLPCVDRECRDGLRLVCRRVPRAEALAEELVDSALRRRLQQRQQGGALAGV